MTQSMYAYTLTGQSAWASFSAEAGRSEDDWRQRLGIIAVVAVLHGSVLAALLAPWQPGLPAAPASAPSLMVQLAMLPPPSPQPLAPAAEPPGPLEPAPPVPEPLAPEPVSPAPEPPPPDPAPALRKQAEPPPKPRARPVSQPKPAPRIPPRDAARAAPRTTPTPAAATSHDATPSAAPAPSIASQLAALAASSRYQPISKEAPAYPPRALQQELEGDCTVGYTVSAQGSAEQARIIGDCHPLFVRPSLQAVATFRYQPHRIDGVAVAVPGVRNTFHYRIRREP